MKDSYDTDTRLNQIIVVCLLWAKTLGYLMCSIELVWNLKLATVIHFIFQFYVSPKLASIVLGIVPPIAIAIVVYGRYLRNITKQTQDSLAKSTEVTELTKKEPMAYVMIIFVQISPEYLLWACFW